MVLNFHSILTKFYICKEFPWITLCKSIKKRCKLFHCETYKKAKLFKYNEQNHVIFVLIYCLKKCYTLISEKG